MLGKLIKHEFIFMLKDFTRTYIIYGGVVLLLKLLISIASGSREPGTAMTTLLVIFAVIYYVFTFVLALLTISHNVRRFKKNMFSQEGYLTNTLPVTPAQHVFAKVIVGLCNYILSFIIVYIGILILLAGTGLERYMGKAITEVMDELNDTANAGHRLIGIISHVDEIKEGIDRRIEVTKSASGISTAKIR